MKEFEAEIGNRIRTLRERAGYSREKMSEIANIGAKFLYEIETGKKGMSAYTLLNISRALNVSCDYILKGEAGSTDYSYALSLLASADKAHLSDIEQILFCIAKISKS